MKKIFFAVIFTFALTSANSARAAFSDSYLVSSSTDIGNTSNNGIDTIDDNWGLIYPSTLTYQYTTSTAVCYIQVDGCTANRQNLGGGIAAKKIRILFFQDNGITATSDQLTNSSLTSDCFVGGYVTTTLALPQCLRFNAGQTGRIEMYSESNTNGKYIVTLTDGTANDATLQTAIQEPYINLYAIDPASPFFPKATSSTTLGFCDGFDTGSITGGICNIFAFLFVPSNAIVDQYSSEVNVLKTKAPLGWWTQVSAGLASVSSTQAVTSSAFVLQIPFNNATETVTIFDFAVIQGYIPASLLALIRSLGSIGLWALFMTWIYGLVTGNSGDGGADGEPPDL